MENIIVAVITGLFTFSGALIAGYNSNKKLEQQLATNQAVINTKIEHLTDELKKYNSHDSRITKLETKVELLEKGAQ